MTIAPIAAASAQMPSGNETFSTLLPAKTRPVAVRIAAPTGKCEYGAWALAWATRAASNRSCWASPVIGAAYGQRLARTAATGSVESPGRTVSSGRSGGS